MKKMTLQCNVEVFDLTDEISDKNDIYISLCSPEQKNSRSNKSQADFIHSNKNAPLEDYKEQKDIRKTIPKIILKKVSGKNDYYVIQNQIKKREQRKGTKMRRKSKHRNMEGKESYKDNNDKDIIFISDTEIDTNNNEPSPRLRVKSTDEINGSEQSKPLNLPFANEIKEIVSTGEITKQEIVDLSEILYIIMISKKRCKDRIKNSKMLPSHELVIKEKTIATEEHESILLEFRPKFSEFFASLEKKLLLTDNFPILIYSYILYVLHDHLRVMGPDVIISMSKMKRLILLLLKENSHVSMIFDVFPEDDEDFEEYYSKFVVSMNMFSSSLPQQNAYSCSVVGAPDSRNLCDKFQLTLPTFDCFRAYAVPGMRPSASPGIIRPWLN